MGVGGGRAACASRRFFEYMYNLKAIISSSSTTAHEMIQINDVMLVIDVANTNVTWRADQDAFSRATEEN
ncbi:hypothetical protein F442_02396 [Phytophthora nicotianae P10297]|uniref:Uncharacterized protein n=3 Tax=Phytophthora nicotianae TaxID=4792 RepID=W2QRA3_PHYN3|nr:hypothetical protein PPTG_22055 [Phytophthora nicotianae INRA-310]ETM01182.1 hypothetical protein L917_02205 [Phytophthora nicotianae]ETM54363.1 hypothetical protein L914_02298 [Phytophthora nicotianae]ETN15034.1 hypothetical protein PPTG_22055 [Phytophthora nicotianae INRA-310]ETP52633.1 hypothetical protein F442_02396 [Phytophthora nicotianae P10297]